MEAQRITITTLPVLPNNIVATNYINLQLISSITGSPISCDLLLDSSQPLNFYAPDGCAPNQSTTEFSSVCEEIGNSVMFTYTIHSQLINDVLYGIRCFLPEVEEVDTAIRVQGTVNSCRCTN